MKFSSRYRCFVLALIPFVYLVYLVAKYRVDVPFWDQWGGFLFPILEKSYQGTLSFKDLWAQHNAHRLFFPYIVMLILARLSNWNITYELTTNILLSVGIFSAILYQLKITDRSINNHRTYWLIPIISLVIFSLAQHVNWLWGWQIQIFLNVLVVTVGIILLANYAMRWLCFFLALLMGVIGTYSFAIGLNYWFIGLLILLLISHQDRKNKILKIIIWVVVSSFAICAYMYDYHSVPNHPSVLFCLYHPLQFIGYVLAFLGALGAPAGNSRLGVAILFGLFGLIASGYLIRNLIRVQRVEIQVLAPYIALILYSIGSATITAVGRVGFGCKQALSSRYVTISYLLWISNIVLLYLLASVRVNKLQTWIIKTEADRNESAEHRLDKLHHACSDEIFALSKILSIMAVVVLLIAFNSFTSVKFFKHHHDHLSVARNELLLGVSDRYLTRLHPNIEVVKAGRAVLKKHKLSPFREGEH